MNGLLDFWYHISQVPIALTGIRVHQFKGYISLQLSTQSSTTELYSQRVGNDNTHGLTGAFAFSNKGWWSQVDIVILEETEM